MGQKISWIKLTKEFFQRADIQVIESMPGGKDYLLFYLKLLCVATDTEGKLRFSDVIPYNEDMLSTITHTDVMVVKGAIRLLQQLELVEVWEDGTYFCKMVESMMDSCSGTDGAIRQRKFRENKKAEQLKLISEPKEQPRKQSNYSEDFEKFWEVYPRRLNKADAYKHFSARIRDGESLENIMAATERYAINCKKDHTDEKFIMHPSTFLGTSLRYRDYLPREKEEKKVTGNPFERELDRWK